jgi:hypothetical protein
MGTTLCCTREYSTSNIVSPNFSAPRSIRKYNGGETLQVMKIKRNGKNAGDESNNYLENPDQV